MKDKINIAELLKDCPKGMELDCTMYDDVKFIRIEDDDKPICIRTGDIYLYLTKFGTWTFDENAKCVIFPKGKTTWEGFHRPFKVGDIVVTTLGNIAIIRKPIGEELFYVYGLMVGNGFYKYETAKVVVERPATEEEKAELFKAIKDNGYKWNAETKTLEKLPKFKVGDRIRHKCPEFRGERIVNICCDTGYFTTINDWIDIAHQDDWELVSEKLVEPKFKVGDRITLKNCYKVGDKITLKNSNDGKPIYKITKVKNDCYETDQGELPFYYEDSWKLVPNKFDITNLVPFESKVLVRDNKLQKWSPAIWGFYDPDSKDYKYKLVGVIARYCIPYEGNEHLLGKYDDCDEYFKTWE